MVDATVVILVDFLMIEMVLTGVGTMVVDETVVDVETEEDVDRREVMIKWATAMAEPLVQKTAFGKTVCFMKENQATIAYLGLGLGLGPGTAQIPDIAQSLILVLETGGHLYRKDLADLPLVKKVTKV